MSAPALVMLAHGSDDPAVQQVSHELCEHLRQSRLNLDIRLAFLESGEPDTHTVVSSLAAAGTTEVVLVPLDLSRAVSADEPTAALATTLAADFPELVFQVSRPIGPATSLLSVIDERLRAALRQNRTVELDGLVLALPRGGDVRGNALVSRRARQWSNHHRLPVVVAMADATGPTVPQAVATLRSQGRRHIAVGAMFIAATASYRQQGDQARSSGAVAVSAPIGPDERLLELVMARYSYAAMDMLDTSSLDAHPEARALSEDVEGSTSDQLR